MAAPPPPPAPPAPLAPPARPKRPPPSGPDDAATRLQRWYRAVARRRSFMVIVNRARRRRKFLDERRRIAQRVCSAEAAIEEMRERLAMPSGHRLVGKWQEASKAEAATQVQSRWRSVRAKKKLVKLVGEQRHQEAIRKIQDFFRRRRQRQQRSPLVVSAVENPFWRPMQEERVRALENSIVEKRKQWSSLTGRGLSSEQLKLQATADYEHFQQGVGRFRYDVWRTLLERAQARRLIEAMEGRTFSNPPPYNVCSAYLLREAEEKHRGRKQSVSQARDLGDTKDMGMGQSVYVESQTEEQEANELLFALESKLGYNFSLPEV